MNKKPPKRRSMSAKILSDKAFKNKVVPNKKRQVAVKICILDIDDEAYEDDAIVGFTMGEEGEHLSNQIKECLEAMLIKE